MRFETRYDRWLVAVLIVIGLLLFGFPLALFPVLASHGQPIWPLLPGPVIYLLALSATLPQYYVLREEDLYIRQGWKKALIPYSALCELKAMNSALSAPVFSMHRLLVTAVPGGQFIIAVAEQERFLAEILRRAPQLEQGSSGLMTRGGSPAWY
jgi:hypothetical protein